MTTTVLRDFAERLLWTTVAAVGAALILAGVTDAAAWEAAAAAGLTAAINAITIFARWRLTMLPDPGAGLPKLPIG